MSQRVVIIGGGVVGLCAAYYCRQHGFEVTLLERHGAQRDGCSFGNAGLIVPSHFIPLAAPGMMTLGLKWMWNPESPFYVRPRLSWDLLTWAYRFWKASSTAQVQRAAVVLRDLNLASRACYDELAGKVHEFGLTKNGLLLLCKSQRGLDEEAHTAEMARQLGLSAEVLDVAATAARDPSVRMNVSGSVYYPLDCRLDPARFVAAMQSQLALDGCEFRWDTEVTGFDVRGARVVAVHTSRGQVAAEEIVLAGGCWTCDLGQWLGIRLPIEAGKGYSLTLAKPRQLPSISAIFTEARVAVTPLGSSLRFGGTMEIAGRSEIINPVRVRGIVNSVPGYYPEFRAEDFAEVTPWRGLRPCSPDGLPYLGRPRKYENVVVAAGHAMMGVSLAPITGRIVANVIAGEPAGVELSLLSPDRYL